MKECPRRVRSASTRDPSVDAVESPGSTLSAGRSSFMLPEGTPPHKHPLWRTVQVLVGIGLLGIVLSMVEWGRFFPLAARATPGWLILAFLVGLADRTLMAGKWLYLLRVLGVQLGFTRALSHYLQAGLVGTAAQWQLGGDITRVVRAGRETGRSGAVVTSVVLEKVVGLAALGTLAVLSSLLLNLWFSYLRWSLAWIAAVAAILAFLSLPFLLTRPGSLRLITPLTRLLPHEGFRSSVANLPSIRESYPRLPVVLRTLLTITLVEQLAPVLVIYLLSRSFGFSLTLLEALATVPIVVLLMRLPITVESLGVREGLLVLFLGLVGLDATQSALIAITSRAFDLLLVSVGAGAILLVSHVPRIRKKPAAPS